MNDKRFAIAVVGAPGSGKTDFTGAFLQKSEGLFEDLGAELVRVGGSPEFVRDDVGQAIGSLANYHTNLMIAMHRLAMEMACREQRANFIVDGTLVETLAHSGLAVETLGQGVKTPENDARMLREMHTATVLANLMMDTYLYSYVVYLPLAGTDLILPGGESAEQSYAKRVDQTIRQVFQNFRMTVLELRGTTEQRVEEFMDFIEEVAAAEDQDGAAASQHVQPVSVAHPGDVEGL